MYFVKPKIAGPAGHTPLDMGRRQRLPADKFRPVPALTRRWSRLHREGSVALIDADVLPAGSKLPAGAKADALGVVMLVGTEKAPAKPVNIAEGVTMAPGRRYIREEDIEGYEAPAPAAVADPARAA